MDRLRFNTDYISSFLDKTKIQQAIKDVNKAASILNNGNGLGAEFLGWLDLPNSYDPLEFKSIKQAAEKIISDSEVLIVIGIGGSYLGAKAVISSLCHSFHNELSKSQRQGPEIYFAGINISGQYMEDLMEVIGDRDFSINVISKSGTTTEPSIAFRIFKKRLIDKYGIEEASRRIYATTDKSRGALKQVADVEGYQTFVIPDDVGGRFSVFTAVGLLPIAAAGIDIDEMMDGVSEAFKDTDLPYANNTCLQYVLHRNLLYQGGRKIEILASFEPRLQYIAEWWKQLYGESEGKGGKGIFPASVNFTADLHSMGQYIQDGERHLFETFILVESSSSSLKIEAEEVDLDGLNYLEGRSLHYVNQKAAEGTIQAHTEGGVPCLIIQLPEISAFHIGYLLYFFEKACAISGYMLGANPFDQPGVEAYKKNMFALLGKPK